jgi:DNA-binding response OmpR family regulator
VTDLQPQRVLVVEDDPDLREAIVYTLAQAGFAVSEVGSVAGARRARGFDLALLDLHLPDGSGLSALSAWRAAGVDAPVLVITAERAPEAVDKALTGLDAWDYLSKPFDLKGLEEAVERALTLARERREMERRMTG